MSSAAAKTSRAGRPVIHVLTARQISQIKARLAKGIGTPAIAEELGVPRNAVIRIKRQG